MRPALAALSLFVLAGTACRDSTSPAASSVAVSPVTAALVQRPVDDVVFVINDAASRLIVSLPVNATTATLRQALLTASKSLRAGDMTEAAAAVLVAKNALNSLDPKETNPDAVAIRLALGYARSVTPKLAEPAR